MKKCIALFLVLAMVLAAAAGFAEGEDWNATEYAAHADFRTELESDYTGKTVILQSNDVHGQIDGYACMTGLHDLFSSLGADVVLADCGDFSQGTVYVNASTGGNAIEMMNTAGYAVACLGNHDFDFGYPQMMENVSKARFPVLCCNVILDETGESILPGSAILALDNGLRIGFVGVLTPETASKVNPRLVSMITFPPAEKIYEAVQQEVDAIRPQVDLVIGLLHLGVDAESKLKGDRSIDLLNNVKGIDFALDGHSHTQMTAGQNGEPIQSTGKGFDSIGVVVIDNEAKGIESNFLIRTYADSPLYTFNYTNETVREKADAITKQVDEDFDAVFATSEVFLNGERDPGNRTEETNMGDLITDAIIWHLTREGGTEQEEPVPIVAVLNGGGIRASIDKGDVSRKDIHTVLPYGNTITVVYITGAELLELLEASTFCTPDPVGGYPQTSGIEWTLDTTKAYDPGELYLLNGKETTYNKPASINRVTITAINGQPFDPEATYAVATNDFCAVGGDTYNVFTHASNSYDTGIQVDDAVMAYVKEVLNGKITEEAYGQPRGSVTVIQ